MTCGEAKQFMAASWLGEMDPSAAPEFERHLQTCAECGAEMASLGGLWDRLGDMPSPEPGQAMHLRWHATLDSLRPKQSPGLSWFHRPVWLASIALACTVVGVLIGANLPRRGSNEEIAKLRDEIASTREMVALSLLQQQSATERLRGVDYTARMQTMEPGMISALVQTVGHDSNVNVRLAAIDALTRMTTHRDVVDSLSRTLSQQESPLVQAALIDYLLAAHDRQSVGTLRQFAEKPDLNPEVLERTHFALEQLSH